MQTKTQIIVTAAIWLASLNILLHVVREDDVIRKIKAQDAGAEDSCNSFYLELQDTLSTLWAQSGCLVQLHNHGTSLRDVQLKHLENLTQRIVEHNPDDGLAMLNLGWVKTEQKNSDEGLSLLRQAKGKLQEDWFGSASLAFAEANRGEFSAAVMDMAEAIALKPRLLEQPQLRSSHGVFGTKEQLAERASVLIRSDPTWMTDPLKLARFGELTFYRGDWDASEKYLDRAVELLPNLPVAWWFKARLARMRNRPKDSERYEKRSLLLGFRNDAPFVSHESERTIARYQLDPALGTIIWRPCLNTLANDLPFCMGDSF